MEENKDVLIRLKDRWPVLRQSWYSYL
jgi:hypothetical protein